MSSARGQAVGGCCVGGRARGRRVSCCRDGCKLRRGVGAGLPRRARWPSSSLCLEVLRPAPHAAQLAINASVCGRIKAPSSKPPPPPVHHHHHPSVRHHRRRASVCPSARCHQSPSPASASIIDTLTMAQIPVQTLHRDPQLLCARPPSLPLQSSGTLT